MKREGLSGQIYALGQNDRLQKMKNGASIEAATSRGRKILVLKLATRVSRTIAETSKSGWLGRLESLLVPIRVARQLSINTPEDVSSNAEAQP